MSAAIPLLPHTSSWLGQGKLYKSSVCSHTCRRHFHASFRISSRNHSVAVFDASHGLCSRLATGEAPHPVEHGAACGFLLSTVWQIPYVQYLTVYRLLSAGTTWSTSAHTNACHSALPLLDWIMTQQFLTVMHDWGHLVVEFCTKTALSDDNLRDLTTCYLPKQQLLSKQFPNDLHVCTVHQ